MTGAIRLQSTVCVLVVATLAAPAFAQRHGDAAKTKPKQYTIEQQNALSLLDGLSDQAKGVSDDATRIRVEARLADGLWERDRDRAKRLYRRAFEEIDDLNESLVDPNAAPMGARSDLYVELFASLFRLDPDFANELAHNLDDDPELYDGQGLPFENLSDRSSTLLNVATKIAPRDPELAAELGRQSITAGIPLEFGGLLDALGEADRRTADLLAGDAVQAALQVGNGPLDLWSVGSYLFPELDTADGGPSVSDGASSGDLKRRFLEAAYSVTGRFVTGLANYSLVHESSAPPEPGTLFAGEGLVMSYALARQMAPLYDAYDPERSAAYHVLLGQIEGAAPADIRDRIASPSQSESADSIAARAGETSDANARASLYSQAAFVALQRDGYEAAKSFVAKIDDEAMRARILGPIAREGVALGLQSGDYDSAKRIAADIPALDERAGAYTSLARALEGAGKRQSALDALDDGRGLIVKEGSVMTVEKAKALVRIANTYAQIDAVRGFDALAAAIDAVNKALAAQGTTSEKGRNPGTLFVLSAYDPSSGLEELARVDYFRALQLAQSLDSKPLAILAQLSVIRGALRPAVGAPRPLAPKPAAKKPAVATKPATVTPAAPAAIIAPAPK